MNTNKVRQAECPRGEKFEVVSEEPVQVGVRRKVVIYFLRRTSDRRKNRLVNGCLEVAQGKFARSPRWTNRGLYLPG